MTRDEAIALAKKVYDNPFAADEGEIRALCAHVDELEHRLQESQKVFDLCSRALDEITGNKGVKA